MVVFLSILNLFRDINNNNRDALSSLELAADANKKPTFCKMLFYFYNKISNLAIVLKLQYVFPPLNNKEVLCYWEEVQIIN